MLRFVRSPRSAAVRLYTRCTYWCAPPPHVLSFRARSVRVTVASSRWLSSRRLTPRMLGSLGDPELPPLPDFSAPDMAARSEDGYYAKYSLADNYSAPDKSLAVVKLVRAFRQYGHSIARLDPLGLAAMPKQFRPTFGRLFDSMDAAAKETAGPALLDFSGFPGLAGVDQDAPFNLGSEIASQRLWTLRELVKVLRRVYADSVGVEIAHLTDPSEKHWLRDQLEQHNAYMPPDFVRARALKHLVEVDCFEAALAKAFPAAKRFGVDGCEALIPLLKRLLRAGAYRGVRHVEMGMAHRGRLSVLAHVLKKPIGQIFHEFNSREASIHVGDVKYHLGYSTDVVLESEHTEGIQFTTHVDLAANPSHLEVVDSVVMGCTRAVQHRAGHAGAAKNVLGVLVHGDASFSGEGLVAETLQLSDLGAYTVGGMVHVVVNNQIGFTSSPHRMRSSQHPTDFAKVLGIPVLHVNADDINAVAAVATLACEWRQRTGKSIVIDLVGYRRLGHNEQDNPMYTHPTRYRVVDGMIPVRQKFQEELLAEGVVTEQLVQLIEAHNRAMLEENKAMAPTYAKSWMEWLSSSWQAEALSSGWCGNRQAATGVSLEQLRTVADLAFSFPPDFAVHPDLESMLTTRREQVEQGERIDWGCAEALAFGCTLAEGTHVRLTGQDSERGTFNQRHAVLHDQTDGSEFTPLAAVNPYSVLGLKPAPQREVRYDQLFKVYNSSLSEAAVLGFEYGYSLRHPNALVMWEAQFGDFANYAQGIIDTYIATGEDRWQLRSNLVMLLPHGFEGQGPDHSNAHVERFLSLSTSDPEYVPGMSPIDIASIDRGFDQIDEDDSGAVSFKEFITALSTFDSDRGIQTAYSGYEAWARMVFESIDTDGRGRFTREDYHSFMRSWLRDNANSKSNLVVVVPSTPAQYFHALRRQVVSSCRKPVALFTPKSLLHHRPCSSSLDDFGPDTEFQRVLPHEPHDSDVHAGKVRRVIMCSGQVYYTLRRARLSAKAFDVVIVRVEELAPFPYEFLAQATVHTYPNAELVWVQEEPQNMGFWHYVEDRLRTMVRVFHTDAGARDVASHTTSPGEAFSPDSSLPRVVRYVGRPVASCATGSFHIHVAETREYITDRAFE